MCWVRNWPECAVKVIELSMLRVWGRRGSEGQRDLHKNVANVKRIVY